MMISFVDIFLFFGFFLGTTLAIGNLSLKRVKKSSDYYTFSIFLMGLVLLHMALYSTGIVKNYELFCTGLIPFTYLGAASQYVRYKALVTESDKDLISSFICYIPAVVSFIIVIIPLFHPELNYDRNLLRFEPVLKSNFSSIPPYYQILLLLYPGLHFFHIALFSIPLWQTSFIWKQSNSDQNLLLSKASYLCALFISLSSVISALGSLFSLNLVKAGLFLGTNAMLLTFVLSSRFPEFRIRLHEEIKKFSYLKSKTRGLDITEIIEKLSDIMLNQRAYAVEGITIKDIAAELDISVHQLSEILNRYMGKNFNAYVNSYRINEAKILLTERTDLSIIDISGEVGFSSSSLFSTAFSKSEGVSPREFRRKKTDVLY